jgi:hypothetical protein
MKGLHPLVPNLRSDKHLVYALFWLVKELFVLSLRYFPTIPTKENLPPLLSNGVLSP